MKILIAALESSFTMFVNTKIPKRWTYFAEIATYVRDQGHQVVAVDCLNPLISHGEVLKIIAKNDFPLIILMARPETARSIIKLSPFIKEISPQSKILIYGDVANYCPNFFKKSFIDAVIVNGDWECGIDDYIDYTVGNKKIGEIGGISCHVGDLWRETNPGRFIAGNNWSFSDVKENNFVERDLYYSITKSQLTITVSRGCPFNCTFCPSVVTFGYADRRTAYEKVVEYIKNNKNYFKSIKLFSPTFTNDKVWVKKFCKLLIKEKCIVPWVCTSRPDCFDDREMIELMAKSGCKKIALGVETLDKKSAAGLKKFRNTDNYIDLVKTVFSTLVKHGIEPKPLLMLGIGGQTRKNIKESFDLLKSFGAKEIRTASYSPRQILHIKDKKNEVELDDIEKMDKMTFQNIQLPGINREEYLKLIFDTENYKDILK